MFGLEWIHFLSFFRKARKQAELDPEAVLRRRCGRAA